MAAAAASWFAGARGLAQLLGRLPLTRTVARYGVRTTLVAARIGLALGCVSIVWSGHTWSTLVYVVVAGATIGALSPLEGIFAATTLPQADLGSLMGGLALLAGVAGASGPILAASPAWRHRWFLEQSLCCLSMSGIQACSTLSEARSP